MMRARAACVVLILLLVPALMGCGFLTMIGIPTGDDQEETPAQQAPASTPPQDGSGVPVAAAEPEQEEQSLYGKWTGTVEFTKYTMLLGDKEARAAFEPGIASTIGQVYSVVIEIYSDSEATLTFDEKTRITGSFTRDGDTVEFVFKKAGSDDFEVGASPPVTFAFTGAIERTPTIAMAGPILYEVFAKDGSRAWTEDGEWIVTPE